MTVTSSLTLLRLQTSGHACTMVAEGAREGRQPERKLRGVGGFFGFTASALRTRSTWVLVRPDHAGQSLPSCEYRSSRSAGNSHAVSEGYNPHRINRSAYRAPSSIPPRTPLWRARTRIQLLRFHLGRLRSVPYFPRLHPPILHSGPGAILRRDAELVNSACPGMFGRHGATASRHKPKEPITVRP